MKIDHDQRIYLFSSEVFDENTGKLNYRLNKPKYHLQ